MTFQQVQPKAGTPGVRDPGDSSSSPGPTPAGPSGPGAMAIVLPLVLVVVVVLIAKLVFTKKEGGGVVVANGNAVVVTDVQMPFGSMVIFMVKWALASIPAMIILMIVGAVLGSTLGALLLGFGTAFR